jgi:hypothetical protein
MSVPVYIFIHSGPTFSSAGRKVFQNSISYSMNTDIDDRADPQNGKGQDSNRLLADIDSNVCAYFL